MENRYKMSPEKGRKGEANGEGVRAPVTGESIVEER